MTMTIRVQQKKVNSTNKRNYGPWWGLWRLGAGEAVTRCPGARGRQLGHCSLGGCRLALGGAAAPARGRAIIWPAAGTRAQLRGEPSSKFCAEARRRERAVLVLL